LISSGHKFSTKEELHECKKIVLTISPQVGDAGVSIQVFADSDTTGEQMLAQMSVREGIGVNMTLCFSQEQAAAVYAATKGSKDPVYVSPFLGRLDDQGQNGMDLVRDIKKMYEAGDGYVHVWGASVRTLNHLLAAVALQAELATAPSKVWEEWAAASFPLPEKDFVYKGVDKLGNQLRPIPYKSVDLNLPWESFDIRHEFVYDYKSTLKQSA
jgi:transaldolase